MSLKSTLIGGTLALLTGVFAGYWLCHLQWEAEKLSEVQADADHFHNAAKKVNEAATEHIKKSEQLKAKINEFQKELAHAKKNNPVPADCHPDPDRLRVIKSAVSAANRAVAGQ
jgi:peptidoglycan hydrolase CwlO-like protein